MTRHKLVARLGLTYFLFPESKLNAEKQRSVSSPKQKANPCNCFMEGSGHGLLSVFFSRPAGGGNAPLNKFASFEY